jgi:hypothetical protein
MLDGMPEGLTTVSLLITVPLLVVATTLLVLPDASDAAPPDGVTAEAVASPVIELPAPITGGNRPGVEL